MGVNLNNTHNKRVRQLLSCGKLFTHPCRFHAEEEEDEIEAHPKPHLIVRFDIPVDGVNHTLEFATDVLWEEFQWEVADALRVRPSDIQLSYKLASQTKDDLARALVKSQDLAYLMQECKPFLTGEKKCRGNKEFRVQLTSRSTKNGAKEDPKPGARPGKKVNWSQCVEYSC